MSFYLAAALRRLFRPIGTVTEPQGPVVNETIDMDLEQDPRPVDEIGELSAAVDLHESVNAIGRTTHEAQIRGAIDELLKRLDKRAQHG